MAQSSGPSSSSSSSLDTAVLGGGCFWCIEAQLQRFKGIEKVVSGYAGGKTDSPSYEHVSSGATGHAEVVEVSFDPNVISYRDLLRIFFHVHDPTTLNQQGADVGTQYRSVILYKNEEQHRVADEVMKEVTDAHLWSKPIVTEIAPLERFYSAEEYHQNYFNRNSSKPYCAIVIAPKLRKLYAEYHDRLKPEFQQSAAAH